MSFANMLTEGPTVSRGHRGPKSIFAYWGPQIYTLITGDMHSYTFCLDIYYFLFFVAKMPGAHMPGAYIPGVHMPRAHITGAHMPGGAHAWGAYGASPC
jgi:hypothetical protein